MLQSLQAREPASIARPYARQRLRIARSGRRSSPAPACSEHVAAPIPQDQRRSPLAPDAIMSVGSAPIIAMDVTSGQRDQPPVYNLFNLCRTVVRLVADATHCKVPEQLRGARLGGSDAKIVQIATYVLVVTCMLPRRQLAPLLDIQRGTVQARVAAVEDARDCVHFDACLSKIEELVAREFHRAAWAGVRQDLRDRWQRSGIVDPEHLEADFSVNRECAA